MKLLLTSRYLLGATTLLAVGASVALAQDTSKASPRSQQRIPISKDAPAAGRTSAGTMERSAGAMRAPARVDTVTVYKTDTLRTTTQLPGKTDTVRVTNTVTKVDTVSLQPPPRVISLPGGLYFGLAGGVSAPNGALFNPNGSGPAFQAQLGWQGRDNLLGVRGDVNWARPGEDALYSQYQADPDIINFNADLKLALPWGRHLFGMTPAFTLYGIGGGSYSMYRNLPMRLNPGVAGGIPPINVRVGDTDWLGNFGWNAGGGASVGWRRVEVFVETRVIGFTADNAPMSRQMPFMFGLNWY
jgi:hypothetical protein